MTKTPTFRPMLSASLEDFTDEQMKELPYPLVASPKIDGIRIVIHPELGPVTRSLKPIPNRHIRETLHKPQLQWLDGEIVVGGMAEPDVFNKTQSAVMSHDGKPEFRLWVFDYADPTRTLGYNERRSYAQDIVYGLDLPHLELLAHIMVTNYPEVLLEEELRLRQGFEGLMLREPSRPYKWGRSTVREGGLMKLKRFADDEAIIEGWEPLQVNQNDPTIDKLGLQKRSSHKAGYLDDDTRIGKFIVRGIPGSRWAGVVFSVGSGLDDDSRREYRRDIDAMMGKTIAYKYQPHGSKDAPRTPIFKGLRHD